MPELPEVQTTVNYLNEQDFFGKYIKKITITKEKLLKNSSKSKFKSFLVGEHIDKIHTRGKYIIFNLSHDKILVIHLRMEGKIFYENNTTNRKHLRIQFIFENKKELNYYDSRMFGTFHIFKNINELNNSVIMNNINFDVLSKKYNADYLLKKFHECKATIKTKLLDQKVVSGIGNIYADEILFKSMINPKTKVCHLNKNELARIVDNTRSIIKKAIKYKGTTISSFKYSSNHFGEYQKYLLIHKNNIIRCPICSANIKKISINGRGTYYCPNCQKI